ncbi:hypothetical protein CEXT_54021 [Caerostris extrusa]|uniref:Uncharacterized protein n=1 Tax=Caerostris extrusa TaxID=172846 RepID=A0AAV4NQ65_CAEEX|nr:hypothetical protein CEXT_54021 [Caerostris extrusa]
MIPKARAPANWPSGHRKSRKGLKFFCTAHLSSTATMRGLISFLLIGSILLTYVLSETTDEELEAEEAFNQMLDDLDTVESEMDEEEASLEVMVANLSDHVFLEVKIAHRNLMHVVEVKYSKISAGALQKPMKKSVLASKLIFLK